MSSRKEAGREIKRLLWAFHDDPTTCNEGYNEYRRMERRVAKILLDSSALSRWQKIRANILLSLAELDEELNREIGDYFGFEDKKRERKVA